MLDNLYKQFLEMLVYCFETLKIWKHEISSYFKYLTKLILAAEKTSK